MPPNATDRGQTGIRPNALLGSCPGKPQGNSAAAGLPGAEYAGEMRKLQDPSIHLCDSIFIRSGCHFPAELRKSDNARSDGDDALELTFLSEAGFCSEGKPPRHRAMADARKLARRLVGLDLPGFAREHQDRSQGSSLKLSRRRAAE